jgi:hypothetical protein
MAEEENTVPEVFRDGLSQKDWDEMTEGDPSLKLFALSNWQDPASNVIFNEGPLDEVSKVGQEKKTEKPEFRTLQEKAYNKYRTFGPVNASINSKSDYTAGAGFDIYTPIHRIHQSIKDLWFSQRNQLFFRITGWITRMQAEGELFLLIAFNEEGKATIRALEPGRIGKGKDTGIITNPEDAGETLFYEYYGGNDKELIPDINIAYAPDKEKLLKDLEKDSLKTSKAIKKKGSFNKIGGYRRFVIHWKNLSGIYEYERDTSSLVAILEAINLYWNAIKWQLDHKKAATSYTNVFKFDSTPAGKLAYHIFKKMSDDQKKAFGLTAAITPGSKLFLMPGLDYDVKAPQMSKLDGDNRDLLNIAGAGAQSPQDMFQGDMGRATYGSAKASRSPLEIDVENMQNKNEHFIKYVLLRFCFHVESIVGDLPETFKKKFIDHTSGKPVEILEDVEPCEMVQVISPHTKFESEMAGIASAYLGNNHKGFSSIGVSNARAAKSAGIKDYDKEKDLRMIEDGTTDLTPKESETDSMTGKPPVKKEEGQEE